MESSSMMIARVSQVSELRLLAQPPEARHHTSLAIA
jgi:hypothetical protein